MTAPGAEPPAGLGTSYARVHALLAPEDRRPWYRLMAISAALGLFEALGLLSILPFLAVIADPAGWLGGSPVAVWAAGLGLTSPEALQLTLGLVAMVVVVAGIAFRMLTTYLRARFARAQAAKLSAKLFRGSLSQPYGWFLGQNTAQIGKSVLSEAEQVVAGSVVSSIALVAHIAVAGAILAVLLAVDATAALAIGALLTLSYSAVVAVVRRRLLRLGEARRAANATRFGIAQEALGSIKEVKLHGLEPRFGDRFAEATGRVADARAAITLIGEMPRNLLEIFVFGGMLGFVVVVLAASPGGLTEALPVLGVFAFAGVRLFPVLQQLYRAYTVLIADTPALAALSRELAALPAPAAAAAPVAPLPLTRAIRLQGVTFGYAGSDRAALQVDGLELAAGQSVAITGPTGAGKSTLIDLLLGLLRPGQGQILIDNAPLTDALLPRWQAAIGYVPQTPHLLDASVAQNVAFGRAAGPVDPTRLAAALRGADLAAFVADLPAGADTQVGERGVRLSGGQRQRIAIARALYAAPPVLVLDEPTSALDAGTEARVLTAVLDAAARRTVFVVTHRDGTAGLCDRVLRVEAGRVIEPNPPVALAAGQSRQ